MEFERSIFHMHERFMAHRSTKSLLTVTKWASLALTVFTFLHFFAYHRVYVNKSQILQSAIEDQILFTRSEGNRNLPYSETSGEYSFCNL
jgi:hypothetical protein